MNILKSIKAPSALVSVFFAAILPVAGVLFSPDTLREILAQFEVWLVASGALVTLLWSLWQEWRRSRQVQAPDKPVEGEAFHTMRLAREILSPQFSVRRWLLGG